MRVKRKWIKIRKPFTERMTCQHWQALEGKTIEEMAQSLLEEEEKLAGENAKKEEE